MTITFALHWCLHKFYKNLQNNIEKMENMVYHLSHVIGVEVFYNYFKLQATKEGYITEYTGLMDNVNIDFRT